MASEFKSLKRSSISLFVFEEPENCISILIDNPSSGSSNTNKEIDDLFKDLNSDAIKFQELYYLERQHINFLDKQRCGNFIAS